MAINIDAVSIATKGYWCIDGPDIVAMATQGHVCFILVIVARGGRSRSAPSLLWWRRMAERTKVWEREKYTPEEIKKDMLMTQIMVEDEEILEIIIMATQGWIDGDS